MAVTGICDPSSCILWIFNPVAHPDENGFYFLGLKILIIHTVGIKNPNNQLNALLIYYSYPSGRGEQNHRNARQPANAHSACYGLVLSLDLSLSQS
jgi:hypothetical protein